MPYTLRGTNANLTRPAPVSTNHVPSTFTTEDPSPGAHCATLAGFDAYSYTSAAGRSIHSDRCLDSEAIPASCHRRPTRRGVSPYAAGDRPLCGFQGVTANVRLPM